MYINRGNHETKEMNRTYGFEGEAKTKHGEMTYKVLGGFEFVSLVCILTNLNFTSCLHMHSQLYLSRA